MRSFIASAALVAGVAAHGHSNSTVPVYTTKHVTAFVTFCPAPTEIVHGSSTITVTSATTLTLDCPTGCAVVQTVAPTTAHEAEVSPVQPTPVNPAPVSPTAEHLPSDSPAAPINTGVSLVSPVSPVTPPTYSNSTGPGVPTIPIAPILPTGTAAPSAPGVGSSPGTPFEGAAPKMAASGASLVALLGLAVFFL
ncbi:MAG: hypothetical protein LQ341_006011 [Variospora aurantia]|nr:MAG: hypothetical protein LQ341_006011 [Variospora aurantia]